MSSPSPVPGNVTMVVDWVAWIRPDEHALVTYELATDWIFLIGVVVLGAGLLYKFWRLPFPSRTGYDLKEARGLEIHSIHKSGTCGLWWLGFAVLAVCASYAVFHTASYCGYKVLGNVDRYREARLELEDGNPATRSHIVIDRYGNPMIFMSEKALCIGHVQEVVNGNMAYPIDFLLMMPILLAQIHLLNTTFWYSGVSLVVFFFGEWALRLFAHLHPGDGMNIWMPDQIEDWLVSGPIRREMWVGIVELVLTLAYFAYTYHHVRQHQHELKKEALCTRQEHQRFDLSLYAPPDNPRHARIWLRLLCPLLLCIDPCRRCARGNWICGAMASLAPRTELGKDLDGVQLAPTGPRSDDNSCPPSPRVGVATGGDIQMQGKQPETMMDEDDDDINSDYDDTPMALSRIAGRSFVSHAASADPAVVIATSLFELEYYRVLGQCATLIGRSLELITRHVALGDILFKHIHTFYHVAFMIVALSQLNVFSIEAHIARLTRAWTEKEEDKPIKGHGPAPPSLQAERKQVRFGIGGSDEEEGARTSAKVTVHTRDLSLPGPPSPVPPIPGDDAAMGKKPIPAKEDEDDANLEQDGMDIVQAMRSAGKIHGNQEGSDDDDD